MRQVQRRVREIPQAGGTRHGEAPRGRLHHAESEALMYNYPLLDSRGHTIGVVSLETELFPTAMVEGVRFDLSAEIMMEPGPPKVRAFALIPRPAIPVIDIIAKNREELEREVNDVERKIRR